VAIFDSHYVAGGCATMFARGSKSERYLFDVGFHYVGEAGPGGEFERQLRPLDIDLDFEPLDPDGFDVLLYPGLEFRTPIGVDAYRQRLLEHFPAERRAIDKYMRLMTQIDGLVDIMWKHGFEMSVAAIFELLLKVPIATINSRTTLGGYLDRITKNPALKAVLMGPHGDYALPPSKVSIHLHCALVMHYLKGAYYLRGGGQGIADELADTVEAAGGTVHLQCPVDEILVENGRAAGVRVSPRGGEPVDIRARAVVSNADITKTMTELVDPRHLPARAVKKAKSYEWPDGLFIACLAIKDDLAARGFGSCNYWQFDTYDVESIYGDNARGGRPNVSAAYVTSATRKDPSGSGHAPPGVETVEVMTVLPADPQVWGLEPDDLVGDKYRKKPEYIARKQRVEDELVHRLDNLFPGSGQHITFRESATPLSHNRYTNTTAGGGYGIAATPSQFGPGRPGPRGPLEGLYLAGASMRTGHGILATLRSGRVAAEALAGDLGDPIGG